MGKRKDAVTVNGKQYLQISESVPIDLDGLIEGAIGQLEDLRDRYGDQAYVSISAETDVDPFSGWCGADVEQTLHYTRLETDEEREKRLERRKKAREQAREKRRKDKELQEQQELETLQNLAKKHGKEVV